MMIRLLGLLMMVGLWSGCGKEIEVEKKTHPLTQQVIEEYECYRDEDTNKPIKHGYYKSYHEDGIYKKVGEYEDDKKIGKWKYINEKGQKWMVQVFKDGNVLSHTLFEYDDNGKVRSEDNFGGGFTFEADYEEVQHGRAVRYFESGKVKEEGNYVDGKLEGKVVWYNGSGEVWREGNYVDGKQEGKWVWYYSNGQIRTEGNYVDGKLDGKWVEYNGSGEVWREGNYVDGKRDGKFVYYDEEGNITDEECFEMGESVGCP